MSDRDRAGLIARILQVRRVAATQPPSEGAAGTDQSARLDAVETRVAHLEQLVEGLQDSVHRESERHARLITELQAQVQPGAMRAALADDARKRGT